MSKVMPVLCLSGMALMAVMSWGNIVNFNSDIDKQYNGYISKAEEYESKEIYVDAVKEYKKAYEMRNNYDIALHMHDLYLKLGNKNSAKSMVEKAIAIDPSRSDSYEKLIEDYSDGGTDQQIYSVIMQAKNNNANTPAMDKKLKELLNNYVKKAVSYDDFLPWHYAKGSKSGYAVVSKDDLYGIVDGDFEETFKCKYDYIGLPSDGVTPVLSDGENYFMDSKGYKKLVPNEPAEYLGSFSEKYAPAKISGKYGYLNMKMEEFHFEYDYAGEFMSGLAPVKKGDKWAVINSSFAEVTGYDFDEIVMDDYGFCSEAGVFFAKKDGKYYLYNSEGTAVSEALDDVKLFASDEPAAVKIGSKWGFIKKDGTMAIDPKYDEADSFNIGYAPVKIDKKWCFINSEQETIVDTDLESLSALSDNGYAFASDGEKDFFVMIKKYE